MLATYLIVALGVLQIADWYTTISILERGGKELNPVMRKAMEIFGEEPALAIKGIIVMLCGFFLMQHVFWLVILVMVYVFVVAWNTKELLKMRG
jgi:hypothetical protein